MMKVIILKTFSFIETCSKHSSRDCAQKLSDLIKKQSREKMDGMGDAEEM